MNGGCQSHTGMIPQVELQRPVSNLTHRPEDGGTGDAQGEDSAWRCVYERITRRKLP